MARLSSSSDSPTTHWASIRPDHSPPLRTRALTNVGSVITTGAKAATQVSVVNTGNCDVSVGLTAVEPSRDGRLARRHVIVDDHRLWAAGPGGTPIDRWSPSQPTVLLLGAEGAGLSPEAMAVAGGEVTIPLDREIESLNVAVAAGIMLERLRTS